MTNEFKKECSAGYYWCSTDKVCKPIQEDAPAVAVGDGSRVAGLGVGTKGEPGVNKKKRLTPFLSFIRRKAPV